MESYSRIRSVKLFRDNADEPFGFSVRGGVEHGTGIFVSHVEPRSMAHRARLKVGDQILRVNGFPVSAALHHECLALMRFRTGLNLKVRSVGMIPVKKKIGDPLTWKLVEEPPLGPIEEISSRGAQPNGGIIRINGNSNHVNSNQHANNQHHHHHHHGRPSHVSHSGSEGSPHYETRLLESSQGNESKVLIDINGHSGLGCCICKGPPERPGIFVQSTKSNGVAREAGLRPGDQIVQCNGHPFLNVPFAEAVYHLKISKHLNLTVIKGAASDLFPGESSGYNSSASSLNGDTHISASSLSSNSNNPVELNGEDDHSYRHGRLPLVSEERRQSSNGSLNSDGRDVALDRHIEWNEVEDSWNKAEKERLVIKIGGAGPSPGSDGKAHSTVRIKDSAQEKRLLEERKKLLEDQRRLLEEAVKFEEEKRQFEAEKRRLEHLKTSLTIPPPPEKASSEPPKLDTPQNTLAGQLHKEILKRVERRENGVGQEKREEDEKPKPGTVDQKISMFASNADAEKRQQHEQLIKEFKRAHRKMFAQSLEQIEVVGEEPPKEERKAIVAKRMQKEVEHERKMVEQQVQGIVRQRQLRIERQHQECQETEREVGQAKSFFAKTKSPPPPPPVSGVEIKTTTSTSSSWTTLNVKLPAGSGQNTAKASKSEANQGTNGSSKANVPAPLKTATNISSTTNGTSCHKRAPTTVKIQNPELDIPSSPSPDYSNSPSPTLVSENRWEDRVSANGKVFSRSGPTKFDFTSGSSSGSNDGSSSSKSHGPRKFSPGPGDLKGKKGEINNNGKDSKEITTSGTGKVTIIVGDPYHVYSDGNRQNGPSKGGKAGGGILKVANGNDHNGGNLPQKTISFGEMF